jgi:hypothetical protein
MTFSCRTDSSTTVAPFAASPLARFPNFAVPEFDNPAVFENDLKV